MKPHLLFNKFYITVFSFLLSFSLIAQENTLAIEEVIVTAEKEVRACKISLKLLLL
jgi:hypothetical protein